MTIDQVGVTHQSTATPQRRCAHRIHWSMPSWTRTTSSPEQRKKEPSCVRTQVISPPQRQNLSTSCHSPHWRLLNSKHKEEAGPSYHMFKERMRECYQLLCQL